MKLLVGLGNPGDKYDGTRHNVGFEVIESLANQANARFTEKKWKSRVARTLLSGEDCILVMPQTYMNLSGEAVGPCLGFHKLATSDVIVIHDDMDLELGRLKLKQGGGHGGHNGLRSLDAHLPDSNYIRVRVGVGRPPPAWDPAAWVLSRFSATEKAAHEQVVEDAASAVRSILERGLSKAMAEHHGPKATKPQKNLDPDQGSSKRNQATLAEPKNNRAASSGEGNMEKS